MHYMLCWRSSFIEQSVELIKGIFQILNLNIFQVKRLSFIVWMFIPDLDLTYFQITDLDPTFFEIWI